MDQTNFVPADADPLMDRLAEQYAPLRARTDELVAALERVPTVIDETTIDRAAGFVKQIKTASGEAEKARKAEGDDFLKAKRAVDGFFKALVDQLAATAAEVERRMQTFLRAKAEEERKRREEEARRAREEAERAAAEARRIREEEDRRRREAEEAERARKAALKAEDDVVAALAAQKAAAEAAERAEQERIAREAAALAEAQRRQEEAAEAERRVNAKAADMARTRGALGGTATLATTLDFEIIDRAQAVLSLAPFFDDDAVAKAARACMRLTRDGIRREIAADKQPIPGVRFFESYKARVA